MLINNKFTKLQFFGALALAAVADFVQVCLFPIFAEGFFSQFDLALDFLVSILLIQILGFHWELFPTLLLEATPALDELPFWSICVLRILMKKTTS